MLIKNIKIITAFVFLMLSLLSVYGQTGIKIPNGTVYSVTIKDESFNFDHADYSVFIPGGIEYIRGVFIHQHGCTMEGRGVATAYDIQYQAFAKKWQLAVIGPDLYPKPGTSCHDWKDPIEDGSGPALLSALEEIGEFSCHQELVNAPWLLWGHSGGGYWVLSMLKTYPERIITVVSYSPAFDPQFSYPEEVKKIPVLIRHAGAGDFNSPGVSCWKTALHSFSKLRSMEGLASIAFNKGQNHNISNLRDIAIPFYEAVLEQRLPQNEIGELEEMDQERAWLCDTITKGIPQLYKASTFKGNKLCMSWMPDSLSALKFQEFIMTNKVKDSNPPNPPENLKMSEKDNGIIELSWDVDADIESGISCFKIYKNDTLFIRYPPYGNFQSYSKNGDDAVPVIPPQTEIRINRKNVSRPDVLKISSENRCGEESVRAQFGL